MKRSIAHAARIAVGWLVALASTGPVAALPEKQAGWIRVVEDDRAIKVETDRLEAVIPKKEPKHWMTGIENGSFLDKATGFREVGDGLMVVDWLMEPGSDEAWADSLIARDGNGLGRYSWYANETDPARRAYTLLSHGSSHRKRMVEGPQLCHRMKPVRPEVIRGKDFVAVKTTYNFEYAAPGRKPGSRWTQLVVFPQGERFFVLMDRIDSVNDSPEMFLRNDMPGCRGRRGPRNRPRSLRANSSVGARAEAALTLDARLARCTSLRDHSTPIGAHHAAQPIGSRPEHRVAIGWRSSPWGC